MRTLNHHGYGVEAVVGGGGEHADVVGREQIEQWRAQLGNEPSGFARDLAEGLLFELERLEDAAATSRRAFQTWQAAIIEAQLATTEPTCIICRDVALRQTAEHLKVAGVQSHETRIRRT